MSAPDPDAFAVLVCERVSTSASATETGATNDSALHWDLICDLRRGGHLTVDGQVLNENGSFVE